MSVSNEKSKSVKSALFVDYKPAEFKVGTQWLVTYYAKNPITNQMQRFRVAVPVIKSVTERKKHGKKIAFEINRKLESGWLPFYSDISTNDFKTFEYCKEKFMQQLESDILKGFRREDTKRTYKSYFQMVELFLTNKKLQLNFVFEINRSFVSNYLDFILYDRSNSTRTYNNHLGFFVGFLNFCFSRGFIKENTAMGIPKKKESEKVRKLLTEEIKIKIKKIEKESPTYYNLCMTTYFCFIRRTELTKLKVHHIDLLENTMTLPGDFSKNKETETVTIPAAFYPMIANHIKKADVFDYVFSANNFKPGKEKLNPKKISDTWDKFRKLLNIDAVYQFYSLKDTGITDLLNSGVPSLKVRDQARHGQLSTTEKYTHRNKKSDEIVRNANFNF